MQFDLVGFHKMERRTLISRIFVFLCALIFSGSVMAQSLSAGGGDVPPNTKGGKVEKSPESKLVDPETFNHPSAPKYDPDVANELRSRGVGGLGAFTGSITPAVAGLPAGLAQNGFALILTTEAPDEVLVISSATGAVLVGPFDIDATTAAVPLGAAFDPTIASPGTPSFMTNDNGSSEIDHYDDFVTYITSYTPPGFFFGEGIAWEPASGNYFVTDTFDFGLGSPVVREITPLGTQVNVTPIALGAPQGIGYDSARNLFWIYDLATDSVYSYNMGLVQQESFFADLFTLAGGNGEGLTVLGDTVYIAEPFSGDIYTFDISAATPGMSSSSKTGYMVLIFILASSIALLPLMRRYRKAR